MVTVGLLAMIVGIGLLAKAGQDGSFAALAERGASHEMSGEGALEITLY